MPFKLKALKDLNSYKDEENNEWVDFKELKIFLSKKKQPGETQLRSDNLFRWLKGKYGVSEIRGCPAFRLQVIIHFFFAFANQYQICKQISQEIQSTILQQSNSSHDSFQSVLDIYTTVAKEDILIKDVFEKVKLSDFSTETLNDGYKDQFTRDEWWRICLFEHHFQRTHNTDMSSEQYETLLMKKGIFLQELRQAYALSKTIRRQSISEVTRRLQRIAVADLDGGISVQGKRKHNPVTLEQTILCSLPEDSSVENLLCADCSRHCRHKPSFHIYINTDRDGSDCFSHTATLISSSVKRQHKERCAEVILFEKNTLQQYIDEDGPHQRFKMRDDVLMGRLDSSIIDSWRNNETTEAVTLGTIAECEMCFSKEALNPLSSKGFDIYREWYLETPAVCQIIFENFINKKTLGNADDKDSFLNKKFTRLYSQYDTLLNLSNRLYCGILQDMHTKELSMNYHSIKNVFGITSSYGMTQSITTAEQTLKTQANSEQTYFNTYLRKYPITYRTLNGEQLGNKSLRDCALVLMMDNLVRLKKKADPDPGENRSMQLCTLPITLKGIPLDSEVVENWHNTDCDKLSTAICCCKKEKNLTSNDLETSTLKLSVEEETMMSNFQKMFTIGHTHIWRRIFEEEIHNIDKGNAATNLDISLASLTLEDENADTDKQEEEILDSNRRQQEHLQDMTPTDDYDDNEELLDDLSSIQVQDIGVVEEESHMDEVDILEDSMIMDFLTDEGQLIDTSEEETVGEEDAVDTLLHSLGFVQYKGPAFLTKHPPPAIGRDDDIKKLKEVLDDVLLKSDNTHAYSHKILFAPDHKIASNLFKLMETNNTYKAFLPEFPSLHLRKSKITILCSAYKDAGIIHILKYIRDVEFQEWKKLISAEHIEHATRYIRRLSNALHIAFFIRYMQTLSLKKQQEIQSALLTGEVTDKQYEEFSLFLEEGQKRNGTFALHYDLMVHCDEVSAIALAERLGGHVGYSLLLAAVKASLPFSFLNGASSYAAFTTRLLHEYYRCGPYYREMKHSLFSTPIPGSEINFALDTQREMDHKDALKAFRSGSTLTSIIPRMSLLDMLNEVHETEMPKCQTSVKPKSDKEILGLKITSTDVNYVLRIASLILRQDGVSMQEDSNIYNVYDVKRPVLSQSILDKNTLEIGKFLVRKFVANTGLFGCSKKDEPVLSIVSGPKELLQKLKQSKGATIKRTSIKPINENKTIREKKEDIRTKAVQRQHKKMDCLSSDMNACQAILKPDCTKPKVMKSTGVKNALLDVLTACLDRNDEQKIVNPETYFEENDMLYFSKKSPPPGISRSAAIGTIEFAGVKFKTHSSSGHQYIKYVENSVLMKTKLLFPKIRQLALCEEKYQFTPDDFKAATREQRKNKGHLCITHLKTDDEILNVNTFDKKSITSSVEGKFLISTFFAKNIQDVSLQTDLVVDVDSELHTVPCECLYAKCRHHNKKYTKPIRAIFSKKSRPSIEILESVKQSKGEAEMAQIDWLIQYESLLREGESAVSLVTSGDIDAVVLHIFALASIWPRCLDNKRNFLYNVYVVLQKPGNTYDIYHITKIISFLETFWQEEFIAQKIALILSLGGNDFLPKFHGISHKKCLKTFMDFQEIRGNLFKINKQVLSPKPIIELDKEVYTTYIKYLYTPKHLNPRQKTYDEIRQMSIIPSRASAVTEFRNPQNWMPPITAIEQLSKNVQCLIEYYLTAGSHDEPMPNFLENGCLKKLSDGTIEYDLGIHSYIKNIEEVIPENLLDRYKDQKKRKQPDTPQKGARRKLKPRSTSTPKKASH